MLKSSKLSFDDKKSEVERVENDMDLKTFRLFFIVR